MHLKHRSFVCRMCLDGIFKKWEVRSNSEKLSRFLGTPACACVRPPGPRMVSLKKSGEYSFEVGRFFVEGFLQRTRNWFVSSPVTVFCLDRFCMSGDEVHRSDVLQFQLVMCEMYWNVKLKKHRNNSVFPFRALERRQSQRLRCQSKFFRNPFAMWKQFQTPVFLSLVW